MDQHTARIFVRDTIYSLTWTTTGFHLWGSLVLSDMGINPEMYGDLASALGIKPERITSNMTLDELTHVVANESTEEVTLVTECVFLW